jgi:DMSO reductase anchor subunit
MAAKERDVSVRTPLHAKIEQMLTEARVIIPGAQALLGFQFAVVLTEAFDKLPMLSKTVHAISLGCMALAIVLLMAPAAYHRIVYAGQDDPEFHRTGSVLITAATVPLALGVAGDIYVVMTKVFDSSQIGVAIAAVVLAGYVALWHVYPAIRREIG